MAGRMVTVAAGTALLLGVGVVAAHEFSGVSGDGWVVQSVGYQGSRGGPGEHYVGCTRADGTGWREVLIDPAHAYDLTYDTGDPCPSGRERR